MIEIGWALPGVIAIPYLGLIAALLAPSRIPRSGWGIAAISLSSTVAVSLFIAVEIAFHGVLRFQFIDVFGVAIVPFLADGVSATVVVINSTMMAGALVYTRTAGPRGTLFYTGWLLLAGSINGLAVIGSLFYLVVFLEITSLTIISLVAASDKEGATFAAIKYLFLAASGGIVALLGVGMVFVRTNSLLLSELHDAIAVIGYTDPQLQVAFGLILLGLSMKIGLFPFHGWLADAHAAAPDAVSALISGAVPALAVFVFLRILVTGFTTEFLAASPTLVAIFLYGMVGIMLVGNLAALFQRHIKLMLAYSTIAQFGLVLVGVALVNETAFQGAIVQMAGHGFAKGGLFILGGMLSLRFDARTIDEYAGLAKRAPLLAGTFVVLAISMIGLPPTVGFIGKWYIALGAIEEGAFLVAVLIVVSTLLTLGYTLPFINAMYFRSDREDRREQSGVTRGMVAIVVIAAVLGIVLGLGSRWIVEVLVIA